MIYFLVLTFSVALVGLAVAVCAAWDLHWRCNQLYERVYEINARETTTRIERRTDFDLFQHQFEAGMKLTGQVHDMVMADREKHQDLLDDINLKLLNRGLR